MKSLLTGLREIARELFMTKSGRVTLVIGASIPPVLWLITGRDYGAVTVLVNMLLSPLWLILWSALFQFLAGVAWALVHWRQPKHSYVVLDLKDGRQRRGMVCMAPCCVRRRIRMALRSGGRVTWSLGDGSDDERFGRDEIESWSVIPVDNPEPHDSAEAC